MEGGNSLPVHHKTTKPVATGAKAAIAWTEAVRTAEK